MVLFRVSRFACRFETVCEMELMVTMILQPVNIAGFVGVSRDFRSSRLSLVREVKISETVKSGLSKNHPRFFLSRGGRKSFKIPAERQSNCGKEEKNSFSHTLTRLSRLHFFLSFFHRLHLSIL